MYLQEKHKQFAIKSYAKFMTRKQVAQVFLVLTKIKVLS